MRIRYIVLIAICIFGPLLWAYHKRQLHLRTRARQVGFTGLISGSLLSTVVWRLSANTAGLELVYFPMVLAYGVLLLLIIYVGFFHR